MRMFPSGFDGRWRLLVRALMSGAGGAHRACTVLSKLQRSQQGISVGAFIDTLCTEDIQQPAEDGAPLTVKPLVCLFPALFQQNLLSFLHLVPSALPEDAVRRLLKCLSQDSQQNPWIAALSAQLRRDLRCHDDEPLYSTATGLRLQELSKHLVNSSQSSGWTKYYSREETEDKPAAGSELGSQRKRKISLSDLEQSSEEMGQQGKRMKLDIERVIPEDQMTNNARNSEVDALAETGQSEGLGNSMSEHIKASVLLMKDLLDSQAEWEQSFTDVFRVLNDCDLQQVEELCTVLGLSDIPEHTLPKVCSGVLAVSPDLSHSTAATLVRSLLLQRILMLSEPASRCLVSALTSVCSRYPRPTCTALIGPVLEEKNIGHPQAELLTRLIESCLDAHYRLLVFQMTLKTVWSEAVLSVIHSLLESKTVLEEELFSQFMNQLVIHCSHFAKSVKFSKILLTLLTKYSSNITAEHKHSLSTCLMQNETFLKKSLQAALKRIAHV